MKWLGLFITIITELLSWHRKREAIKERELEQEIINKQAEIDAEKLREEIANTNDDDYRNRLSKWVKPK